MVTLVPEKLGCPGWKQARFLSGSTLIALFLLAFGARLIGVTLFITPDEDNWMRRTGNFSQALQQGEYALTYQSGHPGVMTMWIARLGIGPEAATLAGITTQDNPVTRTPGFMDLLIRARLAMIAVNSLLIVTIVALAMRMMGVGPALLGGIIMALDPFLVAHGQVVHVDGLSTGFMTVAMLAAGLYWWVDGRPGYLVLCGIASGLAVLTKAPSLVLGLLIPVVAVSAPFITRSPWRWTRLIGSLFIGGALGLVILVALWPALWTDPVTVISRGITFTLATSTEHLPGNFFLGQAVADPGPTFYPIAIMFRLSPLALAGLVALGVLLPPKSLKRPTILLLIFVLGFVAFLSLAGKKLDRYTLPAFPALDLLAGLGLWTLGVWLVPYLPTSVTLLRARRWAMAGGLALFAAAQAIPLAMVAPYALAYYNPLLGGGPAASRVLLVGWAEGLDQAADYLNAQPSPEQQIISIYFPLELNFQGMVAGTVTQPRDPRPANYVVDYVNAIQRGQTPPEVAGMIPVHEVWINGILYARVFHFSPPRPIR